MKKILMMLALLLTAVTGARADEVKTVLDDGVFTGFTATGGAGGTGDGGYAKLVDGTPARSGVPTPRRSTSSSTVPALSCLRATS